MAIGKGSASPRFFVSHQGTKNTKTVFAIFNSFVSFVALCEKNIGHQGKGAGAMLL
jgi:hypothetical protein